MKKENIIKIKTFEFAQDILKIYIELNQNHHYELASQIVRSGTSIGANTREAQRAVSTKDFVNKLGIALKEAEETKYWFEILDKIIINIDPIMFEKVEELIKLLVSIINSTNRNNR
jgi:four helix bundle protein